MASCRAPMAWCGAMESLAVRVSARLISNRTERIPTQPVRTKYPVCCTTSFQLQRLPDGFSNTSDNTTKKCEVRLFIFDFQLSIEYHTVRRQQGSKHGRKSWSVRF